MEYELAVKVANKIKKSIRNNCNVEFEIEIVGSVLRRCSSIKDIDFLISTCRFREDFLKNIYFTEKSGIEIVKESSGPRKCSLVITVPNHPKRLKIDIFYSTYAELPFAKLTWTGPKIYNVRLRAKAKTMGLLLNQYGIYYRDSQRHVNCKFKTVSDIQRFLEVTVRGPQNRK